MKKYLQHIIIPIILMLLILTALIYGIYKYPYSNYIKEESIEVGQTWKYEHGHDNPFKKPTIHWKRVIDVQGDYVLYVQDNRDTLSDKKQWFIISSKLIEE